LTFPLYHEEMPHLKEKENIALQKIVKNSDKAKLS
jgi:hypothetical protein